MKRVYTQALLMIMLFLTAAALAACGGDNAAPPTVVEQGADDKEQPNAEEEPAPPAEEPSEPEPAEDFVDLERASTIDDLMSNKDKIKSYYFEQTINYIAGDISIRTWYRNGMMKIVSSYPGSPESVDYFNCYDYVLISYTPMMGKNAVMITYNEGDPATPENPLGYNYHEFRVLETDSIGGQTCRVLENSNGAKMWISTKHGFPLQVEFTDSLTEEHFVVSYENMVFNQVTPEDVAMPDDLIIYDMKDGTGF